MRATASVGRGLADPTRLDVLPRVHAWRGATMRRLTVFLMIAALIAVLVRSATLARKPVPGIDRSVARFQRQLEDSGYTSQSGTEGVFDLGRR